MTMLTTAEVVEIEGFRGRLISAGDADYDSARAVWNGAIDRRPRLIARCIGSADVVAAVRFARDHDLEIAIRGGGHNVAGTAVCDDGIVIDLSAMRAVRVDPANRRAWVQGGALWGDVDHETQAHGLATTGGIVSHTGVAGLTLGGGVGWLMRKHGLTVDNLLAADVVTANSTLLPASEQEHPGLFWALRGGGGNFGVVTNFEFDAHPLGPIVAFAGVFYRTSDAPEILRRWRDHIANAPDEVTSVAVGISMPADPALPEGVHNQSCLVIGGVYVGDVDEGMKVLQPLREFGTPLADISQPMPFSAVQSAFDPFFPMGKLQSYWKAHFSTALDEGMIAAHAEWGPKYPSINTAMHIYPINGAAHRVGTGDTAFSYRDEPSGPVARRVGGGVLWLLAPGAVVAAAGMLKLRRFPLS